MTNYHENELTIQHVIYAIPSQKGCREKEVKHVFFSSLTLSSRKQQADWM